MNSNGVIYSARYILGAFLILLGTVSLCRADRAKDGKNWSREPFYDIKPTQKSPFVFGSISSIDDHLIGYCGYVDLRGKSATPINGSQKRNGTFWPDVIYQVGNEFGGKCKTIGQSASKGKRLTLPIEPKDTNTILHVDLDGFRALIGKYKFGRIVLENGESTTFALKFLLPPKKGE